MFALGPAVHPKAPGASVASGSGDGSRAQGGQRGVDVPRSRNARHHRHIGNGPVRLWPRSFVSYYGFRFVGAGTYAYKDSANGAMARVQIPLTAKPGSGHVKTRFTITWAAGAPPPGYVFDVQIKRPGSRSFVFWKRGVTGLKASFRPDAGTGTYSFRARIRKKTNGKHSGWSNPTAIKVS